MGQVQKRKNQGHYQIPYHDTKCPDGGAVEQTYYFGESDGQYAIEILNPYGKEKEGVIGHLLVCYAYQTLQA
jgi:hypothetical protein